MLQAVQAERRCLAPDDLAAVAARLHVPASEVYGVATHYPELRLTAPGRHVVRVCAGVSCRVNGSLALLAELGRRLGVQAGRTTADGEVTLEEEDCSFARDEAYTRTLLREFNAITPENATKWGPVHPTEREWNLEPADQLVEFAAAGGG